MEIAEYQNIFDHEEKHFFYQSVHRLVLKLVGGGNKRQILDAGCGTGGLLKRLGRLGQAVGVDISVEAIRLAKRRRVKAIQASVMKLPFKAQTFDVVTCIDVLYHRQVDDRRALLEFRRVLKLGGKLILRVPADKSLVSAHDRFVHTKRRYQKGELGRKLKAAGLEVELLSYIHSPLWPLAKIQAWKEKYWRKMAARSTVGQPPGWLNQGLTWLLDREADLVLAGWRPPVGIGLLAVARRVNGRSRQSSSRVV